MYTIDSQLKSILLDPSYDEIRDLLVMEFGFEKQNFMEMTFRELANHSGNTWDASQMLKGINYLSKLLIETNPIIIFPDFKVIKMIPENATEFVIICPGGGYQEVATLVEGLPVAKYLNEMNIGAFILIYATKNEAKFPKPVAQLALLVNRIKTDCSFKKLNIDNYAVIGFSAGGHLVSNFATKINGYQKYNVPKPQVVILGYSVVSLLNNAHIRSRNFVLAEQSANKELQCQYSAELNVDVDFPKTYIWTLKDDKAVNSQNSYDLASALNQKNITYKLVIYPGVEHGLGLSKDKVADGWLIDALKFWLSEK